MSRPKSNTSILLAGVSLLLVVSVWIIWRRLPVTITRRSDIKFGDELIAKIEQRKKLHGLPGTDDWPTLKQLGFKDAGDFFIPAYQKINDTTFELVYLEGFDGPYLIWNSNNKQWKMSMLEHFR